MFKAMRIGLMLPSPNITMEPEFYAMSPRRVTTHTTRMYLTEVKYEDWMNMIDTISRPAKELATAGVDVILFGCTGASFAKGPGYDKEVSKKINEVTPDTPAITTSTAVLEALEAMKVKKVAIGTPYPDEIGNMAKYFLNGNGYDVTRVKNLGILNGLEIGKLSSQTAFHTGRDLSTDDAEAIFLSCTNWHTIDIIEKLEKEIKKPVISSNQVSMWAALRRIGWKGKIRGFGSLFEKY